MKWPFFPMLLWGLPLIAGATIPKRNPDQVLLVVNSSSPVSKAIGEVYTAKRGITHRISIDCQDSATETDNETLSIDDFRSQVEQPLRTYLCDHPEIDFIVLTKGIPLRVRGGEMGNTAGDGIATPSVDSCLASLGYGEMEGSRKFHFTNQDPSGALGFAWANRYWGADEPFSHQKFGGYLVSRLDGYTQADAIALITRSIASDAKPPKGKMLLDTQSEFGAGDKEEQPKKQIAFEIPDESPWSNFNGDMAHAGDILKNKGVACELDLRPEFVGGRKDLAAYYSWGSNDPRYTDEAYQSLKFAPGSISDTAVSTCARTFLPTSGGQSLTADLIRHGLTIAKGYCEEPYLQANSSPTITLDRYTDGYTGVESLYAGSRFLGWEDVVIGDPLCAPYWKPEE